MFEPVEPPSAQFIDLHSHTTASDGSLSPQELVELAKRSDLAALAITDHDTFDGYEAALPYARALGLNLIRGIELNSRLFLTPGNPAISAHMLAYFPDRDPSPAFLAWLFGERDDRRNRNRLLVEALRNRGIDITLEEVEARGRSMAGRTHFAQVLVEKGFAQNSEDAFRRYLGESAPSYVERQSVATRELIGLVRLGGGLPVIAHPIRLRLAREIESKVFSDLKHAGLIGLEVYHSDHPPEAQAHYHQLALELGLLPTGGSDFHGKAKPKISLGTGLNGNLRVPLAFLQALREVPTTVSH